MAESSDTNAKRLDRIEEKLDRLADAIHRAKLKRADCRLRAGLRQRGDHHHRHRPQAHDLLKDCLLYTSPSPRDTALSRMPSSA